MWAGQSRVRVRAWALVVVAGGALCIAYLVLKERDAGKALPRAETRAGSSGDTQVFPLAAHLLDQGGGPAKPHGGLRVLVIDEGQAPIEGASVALQERLSTKDRGADGGGTATVKTDAEGRCELTVRTEGAPYVVAVSAEGFQAETRELLPGGGEPQELTFVLVPELGRGECRVSGVVVNHRGDGVPNVEVTAFYDYPKGGNVTSRRTKKDGIFTIGGLKPGECRLAACRYITTASGGKRHIPLGWPDDPVVSLDLRGGEHRKGVRIVFPEYSLSGQVRDERGVRVAQARIVVGQGGGVLAEALSEKNGSFSIAGFTTIDDAAVVDVECTATDYEPTRLTGIPVDTTNLEIVLQAPRRGAIRGIVYDATTRQPVTDARVATGSGTSGSGERRSGLLQMIAVDQQGMFTLNNVRAGRVNLLIHAADYGLGELQIDVAMNRTTEIEIPLSRAGILKVNLTRKDSKDLRIGAFEFACYPTDRLFEAGGLGMELQQLARGQKRRDQYFSVHDGDELHLAPDEYDVFARAGSRGSLETAAGAIECHSSHVRVTRVVVESGRTTEMEITLGSASHVLISARPRPNTVQLFAYMIPADSPDLEQVFGREFPHPETVIRTYGEHYLTSTLLDTVDLGNTVWMGILNVEPGAYRVGLYDKHDFRQGYLRGTSMIQVSPDSTSVVEFD